MVRHALVEEFDVSLVATAHALAASIDMDRGKVELEFDPLKIVDWHRTQGDGKVGLG